MKKFFIRFSLVLYFIIIGTVFSYAQKYEAEDATFGGENWVGTEDAGFSGTGYLRNFGGVGDYVEFSITGATAGTQDVNIHYTTGIAGSLHLYVNGTMIRQEAIPTTGGWSNWQDYAVNVTLNAGNNTIKFQHDADDSGYYYVDYLTVISTVSTVTGVTMLPTTLSVATNATSQLTATVAPANATNKTVTWSSSNEEVATVSATGLVTGIAAGNTTITATTVDGSKTATCEVTVVTASAQTIYQAEDATFGGENWVGTEDAGYSGTGYLRNFGGVGDYVEFSITGATAGAQDVNIHYTTGIAGSLHLYVNGTMIRQEAIPTTGGWSNWQDYAVNVTLNAGNNTIKFQHDADDSGYYYVDYLTVVSGTVTENASISLIENDISLFPNPLSRGSLSIKLPEGATRLSIFDVTGKMVYQKQVTKNEYLIDQSVFKSEGVYIVNVMTTKNSMNKKVIVTK